MDMIEFLGLKFKSVTLEDRDVLEPFIKKYPHVLWGYTFPSLFAWKSYRHSWTFLDDETILIALFIERLKQYHLIEPVGVFSENVQNQLLKLISKNNYPVKILRVSDSFIQKNPKFCSHFIDEIGRNYANYLYKTEDLANLKGRHYEKKRNLISQIEALHTWKLEKMDEKHHPYCPEILEQIGAKPESEMSQGLKNERNALDIMLKNFDELHLKGDVINIEDKPVAFSIYGEMNTITADIYFEKADKKYKGLYQLINRETAKAVLEDGYPLINREEDLGLEGLRQAKTSYYPIELVTSHVLTFKSSALKS